MRKITFLLLVVISMLTTKSQAQVTIGSGSRPSSAALLDLKTQEAPTGGATSTTGGLLLPRVELRDLNSLEPFISGGGSIQDKQTNKGLVVYNITDNTIFKPGQYTWYGTEWVRSGAILGDNGLSRTLDHIDLGGKLRHNTEIKQDSFPFSISGGDFIVNSKMKITSGTPGTNKVLTSDSIGTATWKDMPTDNDTKYTATNGLKMDSDNKIKLGGKLSDTTEIEQNGLPFKISSTAAASSAEFSTHNAALKLDAKNKGFMPPRVALTGPTDNITIPLTAADAGMVVYHTGNTAMKEGLHTWNGSSWKELITEVPSPTVSRIVEMTAPRNKGVNSGYSNATNTLTNGSLSKDGVKGAVTIPFDTIAIDAKGSYAFQLRLYGKIYMNKTPYAAGGTNYYFFLYKNGVLADAVEIYFYYRGAVGGDWFTTTYTLPMTAPNCDIGDKIEIKFAAYSLGSQDTSKNSENSYWNLEGYKQYGEGSAARTSMVYWKL